MKIERTLPAVIASITVELIKVAPSGLAIEPIATMQDPEDTIDGDYSIRCAVPIEAPASMDQSKRYMTLFEALIHMENWMSMDEERFKHNLERLGAAIHEFKHRKVSDTDKGYMTTRTGIFDLHELGKKVMRGSLQ